jgi:NADH dehydrogenase
MTGKIVILGGGFGGIRTALDLARRLDKDADITLIDRNNFQLFVPTLYEVASALGLDRDPFSVKLRKTISIPFDDIFIGTSVKHVQGEIVHVDLTQRIVTTKGERAFPYDYLVVALGSQANDFGIPGIHDYAFQFKTIEDGLAVNQRLMEVFEHASHHTHELPIKILIAGAGLTGIELAAEVATCARNLARKFGLKGKACQITLFEAGPKILPIANDRERAIVTKRLTQLGIMIMQNAPIEEVGNDFVKLKDGRMHKGTMVIWTAGVKANVFLQTISGLSLTPQGKITVDEHLVAVGNPRVFAVGDNIDFIDHRTQRPEPGVAYAAIDQGSIVAKNITRSIQGKPLKNHRPPTMLWIAPLGGKYALAHLWRGVVIAGFWGWVIRQLTDLKYFFSILPPKKAIRLFWDDVQVFLNND